MLPRLLLVLSLICHFSIAEEVDGLYVSLVPVADQSAISKDRGVEEALNNVLIKLTGNSEIINSVRLIPFLDSANDYIDALSFQDLPSNFEESLDGRNTGLEVSFSRPAIDQLIRRAQLPVLPSNRPKLLVWIVKDDVTTGREFLSQDFLSSDFSNSIGQKVLTDFSSAMESRGIPYMLPTFDLEDQLALSIDQAWNLSADNIELASERYRADGWIALRFYRTSAGEIRGAWLYQAGGRLELGDFNTQDNEPFIAREVDSLLDSLTRSFSYIPQTNTNALLVEIGNIESFSNYKSVIEQFEKLELVESFDLFSISGNRIRFSVAAEGGAELLHKALVRSGQFRHTGGVAPIDAKYLVFDWVSQ